MFIYSPLYRHSVVGAHWWPEPSHLCCWCVTRPLFKRSACVISFFLTVSFNWANRIQRIGLLCFPMSHKILFVKRLYFPLLILDVTEETCASALGGLSGGRCGRWRSSRGVGCIFWFVRGAERHRINVKSWKTTAASSVMPVVSLWRFPLNDPQLDAHFHQKVEVKQKSYCCETKYKKELRVVLMRFRMHS